MPTMGLFRTKLRYDMFDLRTSAEEARRLVKCQNIYHRGQELAWDGRDILGELIDRHGGVSIADPRKREALSRIFNIILWGELAAWKISAQLADRLVPLEAKMAATSQAMDEARHFYVMHDYLRALGHAPQPMDRAPQALLDIVLDTDDLAVKLLGMQLMVETIALTLFQAVRELDVEPVLTELMTYFERDEARHVGLGMQYMPTLMKRMSRREQLRLVTQQVRILAWGIAETYSLQEDFAVLGIAPREVLERCRKKQVAALDQTYRAIGLSFDKMRNPATMCLNAAVELLFPMTPAPLRRRARDAWTAFWRHRDVPEPGELDVHGAHRIRTARGQVAEPERVS
jgi:hypothetical protein